MSFISKLLGAGQDKLVKQYRKEADKISLLEPKYEAMSEDEIVEAAKKMREENQDKKELPRDVLYESLALARENIRRHYSQRAYDVQIMAALALIDNSIIEFSTGEGKTMVSRLASFSQVVAGHQVHIVTVNEYLVSRDAEDCRECIGNLGITVGYIYNQQPPMAKKAAYKCDIVYGTPSEFGFDYLRDNMAMHMDDKVQKRRDFAIVDEADSILIDEARTPLIISGQGNQSADLYRKFADIMPRLREGTDFEKDEKKKQISATESGLAKVEAALGVDDLYADPSGRMPGHLMNALKAQFLFHNEKDYIIQNGEVKIVDEFTGRIMEGRRWSEGLHQAIEAKEHVKINDENQTVATVTLQNFFRLYDRLSGMTGTAMTEDAEFRKTYNMGVVAIPTNKTCIRIDEPDLVYRTVDAKFDAIIEEVKKRNDLGQPILIGTVSVEMNEKLSRLLSKRGIKHNVLNAKHHEQEAHIIAQAGRVGAVTVATNMAGRGTDIILGGNPTELLKNYKRQVIAARKPDPETGIVDEYIPQAEIDEARRQIEAMCSEEQKQVLEAGGLCVIGTERHDARRIDNQLRGRAGRQGDPGRSQFYISLEDDLMRLFGQDRMAKISSFMESTELPDDMPINAPMVSKAIEKAQRQVESMNFEIRKNVLEYDDVMNKQRLAIYAERDVILGAGDVEGKLEEMKQSTMNLCVTRFCDAKSAPDDWDIDGLRNWFGEFTGMPAEEVDEFIDIEKPDMMDVGSLEEALLDKVNEIYSEKKEILGDEMMNQLIRNIMLRVLDAAWMDHLSYMDYLKAGIGLRGFAQRDPLIEYKDESYQAFEFMVDSMYEDTIRTILRVQPIVAPPMPQIVQKPKSDKKPNPFKKNKKAPTGAEPLEA